MGGLVAGGGGSSTLISRSVYAGTATGRLVLPLALGIALDVALLRAGDAERAVGHVLGDRRAGRGVGVVADRDRRDERGVDAAVDAAADPRPVLGAAVVVGRDRARAEVRVVTDVGVADVGQVRHLGAGADVGILDLDERARLGALAQQRARPQVGERPDRRAIAALAFEQIGVRHADPIAEH